MKGIAIFIPAYNEERTIGSAVLLARKYGRVFVVDDGSTDKTAYVAKMAGAVVIKRGKNGGYGAALKTAIAVARKMRLEIIVTMDADLQHEPCEIPGMCAPIKAGSADVVQGSRTLGKFVNAPPMRKDAVTLLNTLWKSRAGNRKFDYQCGFRAFSRKAIRAINIVQDDYSACPEIIVEANKTGLRIIEVPVSVKYFADEKQKSLSQGASLLKYVMGEIAKNRPMFYFGGAGAALLIMSALTGVFVVETLYMKGSLLVGSALLTVFFGIAGLMLVLIGINLYTFQALLKKKGD